MFPCNNLSCLLRVSAARNDAATATEDAAEDLQSRQRLDVVHEGSTWQVRHDEL